MNARQRQVERILSTRRRQVARELVRPVMRDLIARGESRESVGELFGYPVNMIEAAPEHQHYAFLGLRWENADGAVAAFVEYVGKRAASVAARDMLAAADRLGTANYRCAWFVTQTTWRLVREEVADVGVRRIAVVD